MSPEQPERDLDKEFEALIAQWDSPGSTGAAATPPATPPVPPAVPPAPSVPPAPRPGVNVWRGPTVWRPPEDAFDAPVEPTVQRGSPEIPDEDGDDDFEPEPVVLPPQEDLHFWGIVVGLLGGGLLILYVALTGASTSSWWFVAAVGLFLGGFALLILRQPRERDSTDDGTRL